MSSFKFSLMVLAFTGSQARAHAGETEILSKDTLSVYGDIRSVGADGETPWLHHGFGKGRFGGTNNGDFRLRPKAIEGDLVWQPHFSWAVSGTVVAVAQQGQSNALDLSEAFLTYKPMASGSVRLSGRLGLFWPPVSLEHGGPNWAVTETITPSAISSWIGEEVKLVGVEATLTTPLGSGKLALTGALFGLNDTAGALLAFRGWALHDQKAVAFGRQKLPPLNDFIEYVQPDWTKPVIGVDNRIGYYAKLAWSLAAPLRLEAFRYDNRGDPQAVNADLQWGWRTRFNAVGVVASPAEHWDIRAQAIGGTTHMGYPTNGAIWVDTRFRSAYALVTRHLGEGSVSARIEAFGTRNHGSEVTAEDNEDGWALTAAGRKPLDDHLSLLVEYCRIESRREARLRLGLNAHQVQDIVQVALRLHL